MAKPKLRLTVEQLAALVAEALSAVPAGAVNGRVRAIPDIRTLRYYTTLGLLDRPAEIVGRTAYYGRRHVLQLVAIKRLQAKGIPLAEIQARLLSASERELENLAQVPKDLNLNTSRDSERSAHQEATRAQANSPFWKSRPRASNETARARGSESSAIAEEIATFSLGVPLSADVSLLLPAVRAIDDDDRQAIAAAAQPLLKLLAQRRLLPRKD